MYGIELWSGVLESNVWSQLFRVSSGLSQYLVVMANIHKLYFSKILNVVKS